MTTLWIMTVFTVAVFVVVSTINLIEKFRNVASVYLSAAVLGTMITADFIVTGIHFGNKGEWFIVGIVMCIFLLLLWVVWNYCFIDIPASNPPSIGLRTIWGKRGETRNDIVSEGRHFYLPFFSFYA